MLAKKQKVATHEGKLGEHPVGGAVGAAVGAAAGAATAGAIEGAAIGSVAGVPGAAAGIIAGGLAGAYIGKGVAQEINPTTEDAYWSENYRNRSYISQGETYEAYRPAYRYGVEGYSKYEGRDFDEVEPEFRKEWDISGQSLPWEKARPATRDAYDRLRDRFNKA
jgi:hypothetical protein